MAMPSLPNLEEVFADQQRRTDMDITRLDVEYLKTILLPPFAGTHISPAVRYEFVDDLAVVSCFFNSQSYRSKTEGFQRFQQSFAGSNLPLFTAEASLGTEPSVVQADESNFLFYGGDVMWQKERLLNLLIQRLPRAYTKVAWVDADILFENPNWAVQTSRLLDDFKVVQPFSQCFRLRPGQEAYMGEGERSVSFAAVHHAPLLTQKAGYVLHGHTGYAWAARREILEALPLYDCAIIGGGDDLMAHAFAGNFWSDCTARAFIDSRSAHFRHFRSWAESAWDIVGGSIGFVGGAAVHLWHGEHVNRGFSRRDSDLAKLGFDPVKHLSVDSAGLWRWAENAEPFDRLMKAYFASRREDDHVG